MPRKRMQAAERQQETSASVPVLPPGAVGQALCYPAVYDLVRRLRRRTGLEFDPHWFRHSVATRMLRDGVPVEIVSKVLGHSSVTTTIAVYGHLTAEDARKALEAAGWFSATGSEVSW